MTRVANPGCYATAVAVGLAPLLAAGLVEPRAIVVVAASSPCEMPRQVQDSVHIRRVGGLPQPRRCDPGE